MVQICASLYVMGRTSRVCSIRQHSSSHQLQRTRCQSSRPHKPEKRPCGLLFHRHDFCVTKGTICATALDAPRKIYFYSYPVQFCGFSLKRRTGGDLASLSIDLKELRRSVVPNDAVHNGPEVILKGQTIREALQIIQDPNNSGSLGVTKNFLLHSFYFTTLNKAPTYSYVHEHILQQF